MTLVFPLVFVVLMALEACFPLRTRRRAYLSRILTNLCLTLLVLLAGAWVVKRTALGVIAWPQAKGVGILPLLPEISWLRTTVAILLMDLSFYYWHRLNHVLDPLWRFHRVHHTDPDVDVSTTFRFHVVEILYSTVFRVLQVLIIGISPAHYALYGVLSLYATLFHHSNLYLPVRLASALSWVLVTPRMHGIHHSTAPGHTNSNYSVVFRWWDSLHKTLRMDAPQSELIMGVAGYEAPVHNRLLKLMLSPFRSP
jgi:sterol desaturase/sphingolipid hydroxylase (fatty acid hydroxylase superfamily)